MHFNYVHIKQAGKDEVFCGPRPSQAKALDSNLATVGLLLLLTGTRTRFNLTT